MKRKNTKIGDIFVVKVDNDKKKYFQLIAFDLGSVENYRELIKLAHN